MGLAPQELMQRVAQHLALTNCYRCVGGWSKALDLQPSCASIIWFRNRMGKSVFAAVSQDAQCLGVVSLNSKPAAVAYRA